MLEDEISIISYSGPAYVEGPLLLVSGRVGGFLFTRKTWLKLLEFIFGGWIPLPKCSISAWGGAVSPLSEGLSEE